MATVSDNRIVMSVADIRKKLTENAKAAKERDREVLAEHRRAEQEWLRQARQQLRGAAKLDYQDLRERAKNYDGSITISGAGPLPSCPLAVAPDIERWIERFKTDSRDVVHVEPGSALDKALTWRPGGYSSSLC